MSFLVVRIISTHCQGKQYLTFESVAEPKQFHSINKLEVSLEMQNSGQLGRLAQFHKPLALNMTSFVILWLYEEQ